MNDILYYLFVTLLCCAGYYIGSYIGKTLALWYEILKEQKTMKIKEADIEDYLCQQCEKINAYRRKLQYIQNKGATDQLIIYNGIVYFVEVKSSIGKLSRVQAYEILTLLKYGAECWIVDSKDMADNLINYMITHKADQKEINENTATPSTKCS